MSTQSAQDDQHSHILPPRRKLNLQPLENTTPQLPLDQSGQPTNSQPAVTDSSYWSSNPDELAALSARVSDLASGITEEQKEEFGYTTHTTNSFELNLPQQASSSQNATASGPADYPVPNPAQLTSTSQPSYADQPANQALSMVRSKLQQLYTSEPDPADEAIEAYQAGQSRSKHQQYMLDLTTSGKSLAQIQVDWHNYYAQLPDAEKHEVWQEFYSNHATQHSDANAQPDRPLQQQIHHSHKLESPTTKPNSRSAPKRHINRASEPRSVSDIKRQLHEKVSASGKLQAKHHLQSLLFGLGLASMVVVLLLFGFFNERFIAPFVSPSRQVSATPIVGTSTAVGPEAKIIIPKINLEIPVVYGLNTVDEKAIQNGLESGVVHYSSSPIPGQNGNVVIVGHSSNNVLNKGKFKFAFVLLKRLEIGDTFSINKDGTRYTYQVFKKDIVKPTDVAVLGPSIKPNTATLITCDPPGTSLNRLVVVAEQISPDPAANKQAGTANTPKLTSTGVLPSNAPSLWQRIKDWF